MKYLVAALVALVLVGFAAPQVAEADAPDEGVTITHTHRTVSLSPPTREERWLGCPEADRQPNGRCNTHGAAGADVSYHTRCVPDGRWTYRTAGPDLAVKGGRAVVQVPDLTPSLDDEGNPRQIEFGYFADGTYQLWSYRQWAGSPGKTWARSDFECSVHKTVTVTLPRPAPPQFYRGAQRDAPPEGAFNLPTAQELRIAGDYVPPNAHLCTVATSPDGMSQMAWVGNEKGLAPSDYTVRTYRC